MINKTLIQNTSVAATAIQVSNATIKELSGKCLDGQELKDLETSFALELNNLIMEDA